ncbi:non-ribosomal peptide synthetase [Paenibacillus lutrae]|uniref:Phenyloxazoline synthase MbtB n=1 Tax=Paenibacillus lutrae TaxID=2078573 RepID=A0A7X3JY53_9BACL|nr:non-ribosomal peptide synthetase [Paenibacillus lutrae]MVO98614.1 amino acid adenylation domain-containing protein [Paenibacillus lutrae]
MNERLTKLIFENCAAGRIDEAAGAELLSVLMEEPRDREHEGYAIIGMSARLASFNDIGEYWQGIAAGKDSVRNFPENRKTDSLGFISHYTSLNANEARYSDGGYLNDIDQFDAAFFRLSQSEARLMDPSQRLFLQTAWETIEDAGYANGQLKNSRTGVYLGYGNWPAYGQYIMKHAPELSTIAIPGNLASIIAGRISYLLDLKGPSLLVDTACSSSLAAVQLACQSLRSGECDLAIAGGVKISLFPVEGGMQAGIESSDYKTRTFDDSAQGTVWGEGSAAILIKPLRKAIEDGDRIHAIIKGGAMNQDGTSVGLTAPNMHAQEDVIVSAWKDANVAPESITYMEAHGTATKLGDPIEIEAIDRAFRRYTDKKQFCAIGSVKTNIGHLDFASGIAGLIKVVLALKHKKLPPALHFQSPNKKINFADSPVYISDTLTDWEAQAGPRRCGVSSFGFSGTNCHLVLEEAPPHHVPKKAAERAQHIFVLSAKSERSLKQLLQKYAGVLDEPGDLKLGDVCYTASVRREHFDCRLALIVSTLPELREHILTLASSLDNYKESEHVYYRARGSDSALNKDIRNEAPAYKSLQETAANYVSGSRVDWGKIYSGKEWQIADLPTYAFDQTRMWLEWDAALTQAQDAVTAYSVSSRSPKPFSLKGRESGAYSKFERMAAAAWSESFGVEELDIRDNFFELGGDSLMAIHLLSRFNQTNGYKIDISTVYNYPVLEDFSSYIESCDPVQITGSFAAAGTPASAQPGKAYDPFPLTEVQMAYLRGRSDHFELGGVSTHTYLEIETRLDLARLNRSLQKVIDRHPMLRTVILESGEQQVCRDTAPYSIFVEDISRLTPQEQQMRIEDERTIRSHRMFPIGQWPMFDFAALRLTGDTHYLFVSLDALIIDGASTQTICKELIHYYQNPHMELPALDFTFRDYMMALQEVRDSHKYIEDKAYWSGKIKEFPMAPQLGLIQSPEHIKKPQFQRLKAVFHQEDWSKVKDFARKNQVTPSVLLCTLYAEVLAYWSNQPRFAMNLTMFNRNPYHPDVYRIVGDFTSVILLDIDMSAENTFRSRAQRIQNVLAEALEHRAYEGIEVIRDFVRHNHLPVGKAAMPIVFTSMLFNQDQDQEYLKQIGQVKMGITQTPQVYLDNQVMELDGQLSVTWDYVDQLFDPVVIEAMFKHYMQLVEGIVQNGQPAALDISPEDKGFIQAFNLSDEEIAPASLNRMFCEQARMTPDSAAVIEGDKQITYRELDEWSNRYANALIRQGIGQGDFVGVLASRRSETIAQLLGVMKLGAAYIPIDPDHPEERRNHIVSESGCKLLLDQDWNADSYSSTFPGKGADFSDEVAYVLYTSGSTGMPKGVVITHKAVSNTIQDMNRRFAVSQEDRILAVSSLCFDLSVYDVFGALSSGAAVVLVADQRDPGLLVENLIRHKITIWNSVPALLEMVLEYGQSPSLNDLRLVLLSGDWIPVTLPERINRFCPKAELISLGGATEVSIWSIYYPVRHVSPDWTSIPYGYPLANQTWFVLNYQLQICPVNVAGELYIGGVGIAEKYWNDPVKSAQAFIDHPELGRLYRTGDYGVLRKEGYIEFQGRKDTQIKIRGHRIELGEIEHAVAGSGGIKRAVAIVKESPDGKKYLVLFYSADKAWDSEDLREVLTRKLPEYMVPRVFIHLQDLPLSANGKIDQKALMSIPVEAVNESVAPRSAAERRLAEIWREVLSVDHIGVTDNFFDLGGDSLIIQRLKNRIEKEFETEVSVRQLFEEPTIERLAVVITGEQVLKTGSSGELQGSSLPHTIGTEEVYYWSPVVHWTRQDGMITAGDYANGDPQICALFPDLYFHAQKGASLQELSGLLAAAGTEAANRVIQDLIDSRVLVHSILPPAELFSAQEKLFRHEYGDDLLYKEDALQAYKEKQLNRTQQQEGAYSIKLGQSQDLPAYVHDRRTYRQFDHEQAISGQSFAGLLSILKQIREDGKTRYYYPSAGGLYPIDVYINIKKDRVENITGGLYLYNPVSHTLINVKDTEIPMEKAHLHTNMKAGETSAFTIFLMYNPDANMPRYGYRGYYYALLEAGVLIAMLTQAAGLNGIGVCSVGEIKYTEIEPYFALKHNQLLLHTIEGGSIPLSTRRDAAITEHTPRIKAPHKLISESAGLEQEYYPLSSAQKRVYILQHFEGGSESYNTPAALLLEGRLDRDLLQRAFQGIVERHESLRTSFHMKDGAIVQKIQKEVHFGMEFVQVEENRLPETITRFIRPFDLERAPLLRAQLVQTGEDRHILLFDLHHIVTDWSSTGILVGELAALYNGFHLKPLPIQYKEFVVWQEELLRSPKLKEQEDYWISELTDPPVLQLPIDYRRPRVQSFEGDRIEINLDGFHKNKLKQLAQKTGTTLYMVLLAAFNVLMSKYTGQEDIIVGSPVAGREQADLEKVVGMFLNTLALRNQPRRDLSFHEFLQAVRENMIKALDHQDLPFEELVNRLDLPRETGRNPLFDVMFVLQENWNKNMSLDGLSISSYPMEFNQSRLDLTLTAFEEENVLRLELEYGTKLFRKDTIQRMALHLSQLLQQIAHDPDLSLAELEIMPPDEKNRVLYEFNRTAIDFPAHLSLAHMFARQVSRTPLSTALVYKEKRFTYADLDRRSDWLGRRLREAGVKANSKVGLVADRSDNMVVGILAILKAGGAFVPIDPNFPQERIAFIVKDAAVQVILAESSFTFDFTFDGRIVGWEAQEQEEVEVSTPLELVSTPDDLAYVMYTSGSTGVPKGVLIEQRSVVNLVCWFARNYDLRENRNVLQMTNLTFDVAVEEIMGALLSGATLVVPHREVIYDKNAFAAFIGNNHIHLAQFVPATLKEYLFGYGYKLQSLDVVISGGEKLDDTLKDELLEMGYSLYDHYGPTEATVDAIVTQCQKGKQGIGRPIDNVNAYIISEDGRPQPIGIIGELCLSGSGIASGYLNRDELTRQKFVENPFVPAGSKRRHMYKTGDLARWNPDGTIELLGRIDDQVKIRGIRIELGEIEEQIRRTGAVKDVVVIGLEDARKDKYLCAYVVSEEEPEYNVWRNRLNSALPDSLIPSVFCRLDSLPLNANGKVDRSKLPAPAVMAKAETRVEPTNHWERTLLDIWKTVLSVQEIGIDDQFFDRGGNSLKVIEMYSLIQQKYPDQLQITDIFAFPTVRKLASMLEEHGKESASLQALSFPQSFLLDPGGRRQDKLLRIGLERDQLIKLQGGADGLGIELKDMLLGAYLILLSEVLDVQELGLQMCIGNRIIPITINLTSPDTLADLFRELAQLTRDAADNKEGLLLENLGAHAAAGNDLYALFYYSRASSDSFSRYFDLTLRFQEEPDKLTVLWGYNAGKLAKHRMEECIRAFIRILDLVIETISEEQELTGNR